MAPIMGVLLFALKICTFSGIINKRWASSRPCQPYGSISMRLLSFKEVDMMRKRSICWILVICMTLSLLPARPAAAEKEPVQTTGTLGYLEYVVNTSLYYPRIFITGCNEYATSVTIPPVIDGIKVTGIDDYAFYGCSYLESVILPETLVYIGLYAFTGCSSLTSIRIPAIVFDHAGISAQIIKISVAVHAAHIVGTEPLIFVAQRNR